MATAKGPSQGFKFKLPVYLKLSTKRKIDFNGLKRVQSYLASDISLLNKNLQINRRLRSVRVSHIQIEDDHLCFGFILETKGELEDFHKLSRSGTLSKTFTNYAEDNCLGVFAGCSPSSKLKCRIEMDEQTYIKAKAFFDEGDNGDGSMPKAGKDEAKQEDEGDLNRDTSDQLSYNASTDRTDPNLQFVQIEVILPLHLEKYQRYGTVSMKVTDQNVMSGDYYKEMTPIHQNLWKADLMIPASSHMEKVFYQFIVEIFSSEYLGLKQSSDIKKSMVFGMIEAGTVRNFFNAGVQPFEIFSHLRDIVIRHAKMKSISECTIQIENLLRVVTSTLDIERASWIYNQLLEAIDKHSQTQLLLCIVVFGNLFISYRIAASRILTPEFSKTLLNSLTNFKSSDLASSCNKYLFSVVEAMCRIALGQNYCFVSCIYTVHPFFEESFISGKLIEIVRKNESLVADPKSDITYKHLSILSEKLCKRTENDRAKELLQQLIQHIPVEQGMKVCKNLRDKSSAICSSDDWQRVIYNALLSSIKSFLSSAKLDICKLEQFCETLSSMPEIVQEAVPMIENAFTTCINNANRSHVERLKAMILSKSLFLNMHSQLNIIKCFASTRLPSMHILLIDILKDPKFKEAGFKIETEFLCECFDKAILYIKREEKDQSKQIEFVYTYLANAHATFSLRQSKELVTHIYKVGVEYLEAIDLKKLMRMVKVIEKLAETNVSVGDLFKEHVQSILKHQYESNYHEMLMDLCGTFRKLRIDSSVTASIVNAVINISSPKNNQMLVQFKELVLQSDLWTAVMQATGKEVQKVRENINYQRIAQIFKGMVEKFRKNELPYGYLDSITDKTSKDQVASLVVLDTNVRKTEILNCWDQIQSCFAKEVSKINSSCVVIQHIQNKMPIDTVISNARTLVSKLELLKNEIEAGNITLVALKDEKMVWNDLQYLPERCIFLEGYVKSKIFWRSCSSVVKKTYKEKRLVLVEEQAEREPFESIHRLFDKSTLKEDNAQDSDVCEMLLLLEILTDKGIEEYTNTWMSLLKDQDRNVGFVLALLHDADVDEEICYVKHILGQPVPEKVKDTFHRLKNIRQYEHLVANVCKSLEVFDVKRQSSKDIHDAISTFESLKESNIECSFSSVVIPLEKIDFFSKNLLQETLDILTVLSGSLSLIEFLKEIVEEDIRNLIDAVEDISEQHVQESTVSALIDVKGFFQGILIKPAKDLTAQEFLDLINNKTKTSTAAKIPAKIEECMNSLHNLKSLYGNVANRGEMTAEIIANIISKGNFSFRIDDDGTCEFCATYKHGSLREKHASNSLIDLRSRALLLMNTRTKAHEHKLRGHDLEKFVSYIDLSIEIINLLSDLHQSGNMSFITYSVKKDGQALSALHDQLFQSKIQWDNVLKDLRDEFYLLNFVHGPEIHLLYNCFVRKAGMEKTASLLRFIHPDLKLLFLLDSYATLKTEGRSSSNEDILRCFGTMLHNGYEGKQPLQRPLYFKSHSKHLTETVQNRRLFVAALEENSNQVVKTLLSLYMNTTQTLPEPHQVLFCTKETTWNELELLLYRCLDSQKFTKVRQLFCIANVELLPNEFQFALVEKLKSIRSSDNFLLSLICRGTGKHPLLDELSSVTNKSSAMLSDEQLRQAFKAECPGVFTFTSTVPGLGKTTKIKETVFQSRKAVVKLHLSGPLQKEAIIEKLSQLNVKDYHALHIDIGSVDDVVSLDTFIFELIILRHVKAGFKSFSLETGSVFIEVANTINDSLRNSINTVMAFNREHLKWMDYDNFIVSLERNSPVQVVCQYLNYLKNGVMDHKDLQFGLHSTIGALPPSHCRKLLKEYFAGDNLSFTVVNIFLNVLADQLKKMSCSSFFRVSRILEMVSNKSRPVVRSTLVEALIEVSREFSSRSIKNTRSTQMSTIGTDVSHEEETVPLPCKSNLAEVVNDKVDGMIRWEDSNHLIFAFHNQNIQTISPMYRNLDMVPSHIRSLFKSQMKKEMQDFNKMNQKELLGLLQKVARTNPLPMNERTIKTLNAEYALTPDNLLKMILIILRVKANIPVLVMGETGCGKTSLIRYLATVSDVEFEVLSIHAGLTEEIIIQTIVESNKKALTYPDKDRWLFLDEINTSEHIGLMTDAICDRTFIGKPLAPNLKVMGACNPYKLRTQSAISTAGLKGKVQTDELSRLVYRVLPLPESLVDYVWDFGTLSDHDEAVYIRRMVDDIFPDDNSTLVLLQNLLSASQMFVRKQKFVSYCISLRDIQRCKTLIRWFLHILPKQRQISRTQLKTDSIIFALSICYHCRFSSNDQRFMYRKELESVFMANGINDINEKAINTKIVEEQKDILDRMDLPPGTAKNTALQENVFVILVCLLNKIPIFLVGKPGCSKSLSMQVIRSNLRGKDSKDRFFKMLPQLYCVSFQGSESSTSDGIIKVFEKAIRYQESNNAEEVLSVVILDEIGLAEVSRFNPLKVLHNLLEPDGRAQPDAAVVGISNWALDDSKMNRGIHLSRPDMDVDELFQTGVSISESFIKSKQLEQQSSFADSEKLILDEKKVHGILKDIARSYLKYVEKLTFKNFHGLRDYYSLVKFVSRGFLNDAMHIESEKDALVLKGLQRNFGGLPAESATLLKVFRIEANSSELGADNVLQLMEDNITDPLARHLMCITCGDSALALIENLLTDMKRDEKVVIFGSLFEEDQTADYNYRILSRIILCMEQGFVLILKDLENIYGSLYDMLNQNYTVIGKKKHCRVALGNYSNPICHVHDRFRCIVLVDESNVDYSDPPFLNRFEKQFMRFTDTVSKEEEELIRRLNYWMKQFSDVEGGNFDQNDCFPIFSQDLIPSLVIKTSRMSNRRDKQQIFENCKTQLLRIVQSDAVFRLEKNTSEEMRRHAKRIKEIFLQMPIHSGIWQLIEHQQAGIGLGNENVCFLTVVFTNSSMHSQDLHKHRPYDVQIEKLGAFKSEKQLHLRIHYFFTEAFESILFLHCGAAENEKHIPLAKTTIDNIRAGVLREGGHKRKHVYLIIHLNRRRAKTKISIPINYLSGWDLVTLDSLSEPAVPLPQLSCLSLIETVQNKKPLNNYITEQLFWSFSRLRYEKHGRELKSIQDVIEKIENSQEFLCLLEQHVLEWIFDEFSGRADREWVRDIALDPYAINTSSSFLVALEQEILNVMKVPICKLIFQMENMYVITCFFCEDRNPTRNKTLEKMLRDGNFFSISNIHEESGPECYPCAAIDMPLRMPFSKHIFDKIENTKEEFMDTYYRVKEKCDLDEEDELPKEILEQLLSRHEGVVVQTLPDLSDYLYTNVCDDYYHDFCYFVSLAIPSNLVPYKKYQVIRWSLEKKIKLQSQNPMELIVKLHAMFWLFSSKFSAEYVLFETCSEIFNLDVHYLHFLGVSSDRSESTQDTVSSIGLSVEPVTGQESVTSGDGAQGSDSFSRFDGIRENDITIEDTTTTVYSRSSAKCEDTALLQDNFEADENQANQTTAIHRMKSSHANDSVIPGDSCFEDEKGENCLISGTMLEFDTQGKKFESKIKRELKIISPRISKEGNIFDHEMDTPTTIDSEEKEMHCTLRSNTIFQDTVNIENEIVNSRYCAEQGNDLVAYPCKEGTRLPKDLREDLVQFICRKLFPSKTTLDHFSTIKEWAKCVSVVLTNAVKVSSDIKEVQQLRFCYDLFSKLGYSLEGAKLNAFCLLGCILQTDEEARLDDRKCFECVCDLVFYEPRLPCKDSKYVLSYYLSRCITSDTDTEIVIQFLQLPLDESFMDHHMCILRPPLQLSLKLAVLSAEEDVFLRLIEEQSEELALKDFPFLKALDLSLKAVTGTPCMDSQFAVLVVDMIEENFKQILHELINGDVEKIKMIQVSAQTIILDCNFGLKFLSALAIYKSFATYVSEILRIDLDTSKYMVCYQIMKGLLDKEGDSSVLLAMKRYFIKETVKGKLPWSLFKTSEKLGESFEFLKSWQWTDKYLLNCIECHPLLQYAPTNALILHGIFDEEDQETQRTKFQEYIKDNREGTGLLALHSVCLSRFYIARRYKYQHDTQTTFAKDLIKIAEKENMDDINLRFLSRILGVCVFPLLEINEQSSDIQTTSATFASSLFALLLATNHDRAENDGMSLLSRILLWPSSVDAVVMRSLMNVREAKFKQSVMSENKENYFMTCKCGYRVFKDGKQLVMDVICPMCKHTSSWSATDQKGNEPVITEQRYGLSSFKDVYVNEIVTHFIDLCVHSCLIGSHVLETANEKALEEITGISEIDDIPKTLFEKMQGNVDKLQTKLELTSREICIFLQACLSHVKDFLTTNETPISSEESILDWACQFILQLQPLVKNRYATIIHAVGQQNSALKNICEEPELIAYENDTESLDDENRQKYFPSLFRSQGKGTRTSFELELHMLEDGANHPHSFLLLVLGVLPDLALTEHILSILRWHMATVTQIECRMKKRECLEMTVEGFIHYDADKNIRERLQERFEHLQGALSSLANVGRRFEITSQTKMKDCLIMNMDSSSSLYMILIDLCDIQNAFLDKVLEISATKTCTALQFLEKDVGTSAIPVVSIAELKSSAVVTYKWNDELLKFSHADLRYGYGAQIQYEFEAIEKMLVQKMVVGKSFIVLENCLPSVTFVDEFYKGYGKMAREINDIVPQKPLTTEIKNGIKEKREQHPRLTAELITHIGVLISLVKKTKGDPEMSLLEYVDTWKHVLTSPMASALLPAPETSIKLCHLIALYGLLEELNADSLVDSVDKKYQKPISFDIQNQLNALLRSNKRQTEMILTATKRFVYRCLSSGDADSAQPLAEYLADDSFWPFDVISYREGQDGSVVLWKSTLDSLPKDLRVHHVSKMILHLGSKLKELSTKDMKLSDIATSFSSRGPKTTADRRKTLAKNMII